MNSPLNKKRNCFATSKDLAAAALREAGAIVSPAIWNDGSVHWHEYDAVIIRSTWDYHFHPDKFRVLLDVLEAANVRVFNSLDVVRWNMNKRYLLELQSKGVIIPRAYFAERGDELDIARIRSVIGMSEVVAKPEVSASAWNTRRYSLDSFNKRDEEELRQLLRTTNLVIQEFLPEVLSEGEWSMMFFGDQFSHAVRKFPAPKDFRVQEEFGGTYRHEPDPPAALISQAKAAVAACKGELLYARVDGIMRSETFIVMEAELLEPALFFEVDPAAPGRFAGRLSGLMGDSR